MEASVFSPRKIVFLGSGAFGLPTLESLAKHHRVCAIVSQPDKPAGRGKKLSPTPIAQWAAEHLPNVPIFKPANINEPSACAQVRAIACDAWVVIAFGQKLSSELLQDRFAINLHASLLPRWRGAAPINAAILAGDRTTGNSVITLADQMDAGLILGTSARPILPDQTAGQLHDLLAADGPALVLDVLTKQHAGTLKPITQDVKLVTKARKLSRADGLLDFHKPAEHLRWQIHGLTPWPGVSVTLDSHVIKILHVADLPASTASHASSNSPQPGILIDPVQGLISTGDGQLKLMSVQPAGGKPMRWSDFLRGRTLHAGAMLLPPPPPTPSSTQAGA
jgi:methionyl-tRNA formyltransferase